MIEFRFKKLLIIQGLLLAMLSLIIFFYLKKELGIKYTFEITKYYFGIWFLFILANILFIGRYALPSKKLLATVQNPIDPMESGWSDIESSIQQKTDEFLNIQSEYENETLTYKTLLDSLKDPVIILDKKENVFYSNLAFTHFFNLPDSPKDSPLIELIRHFEFQEFVKNAIQTNVIQKISDFSFDHIQETNRRYFDISIFPMNLQGKYLCVFHNVTERKLAEIMREDFVANFSHEVRTPLTIINGQSQILSTHHSIKVDDVIQSSLKKIETNTKRLLTLFNDMLTLTQIEKQRILKKEQLDIEMMIEPIFEEIKSHYKIDSQIIFNVNASSLFADYHLFEQVLINLLDNSFKYAKTEKLVIEIALSEIQNEYVLVISDNGIGISEEHLPRIFERFFRSNMARSGSISGTGLGLSIVKHIMINHGGKVKVESVLNHGSKFSLFFPKN
jgi:two-component system phosphate regulon sensor histidine kinase PhoR